MRSAAHIRNRTSVRFKNGCRPDKKQRVMPITGVLTCAHFVLQLSGMVFFLIGASAAFSPIREDFLKR